MCADLTMFNAYKAQLSANYTDNGDASLRSIGNAVLPQSMHSVTPRWSEQLSLVDQYFYKFSFYQRTAAKLELQLLMGLLKDPTLDQSIKPRVEEYARVVANFLIQDATLADNTAEAGDYQKMVSQIGQAVVPPAMLPWDPCKKLQEDFKKLRAVPKHVTKILSWLSFLNIYRLIGTFSRLEWMSVWALAQERHWMDAQGFVLGHPINRAILDASTKVFNFLSVFLFFSRIVSHGSMVWKHYYRPTTAEQGISPEDIRNRELYDRMSDLVNDTYWLPINFATNYQKYTHISNPVANGLLGVALLCDITWLIVQWRLENGILSEKEDELKELAPYLSEIDFLINQKELTLLKDMHFETQAKMAYCVAGALLITSSYLSVLVLATPLASTLGFCLCVVGFGMYVSAKEFAAFMRVAFGTMAQNDALTVSQAGYKFAITLAKAALMPLLIVGLFTISWPAALIFTVLYTAYEHYGPEPAPAAATDEDTTRHCLTCFG